MPGAGRGSTEPYRTAALEAERRRRDAIAALRLVATVAGYAADRIANGNGHGLSPTASRVTALEVADELEAIVTALRAPARPAGRIRRGSREW